MLALFCYVVDGMIFIYIYKSSLHVFWFRAAIAPWLSTIFNDAAGGEKLGSVTNNNGEEKNEH